MYVKIHVDHVRMITQALEKLQKENAELKGRIEAERLHEVVLSVSEKADQWLNRPYDSTSEQQDIKNFAEEITKYIEQQLGNQGDENERQMDKVKHWNV